MANDSSFSHFNVTFPVANVAHVEINRPKKLNAFNKEMWLEYGTIFKQLSSDSSTRAIILSGAGERAFTAGLDLMSSGELTNAHDTVDAARKATALRRFIKDFQDAIGSAESCEKPVICVLHGISYGLAIDIATCADIRICASDTKFAVKEVDIGIAADIGTLSRLPKIVGSLSWVKEIAFTARVFGADEAFRQGFVSSVQPTKAEAIEEGLRLATLIAEKSPLGVQGTKSLINYSIDHTIQDGLEYTRVWNACALQAPDPAIAIQATMQKKKANFAKL
ncbi:ClpP/crotonase-like domain-containing protein [Sphaerosporella brunnea]|uniref:ClpP/crotonase-like domain-containing protein n=1 Tax=Sphaerosporella brunnea TaxID=1250544 RepID=A0A5J5EH64_9PEZI|nr:ClpP/crotonase-like domain-containing protein [Sphaerosporella brunnea]